ncbi:DUF3289 family protein [Mixta tenebrionis]|uniref:DUF3289 family protein n=1 Tax=Mixta tenebrionis TaxID=2562439 RepID=A0A506VCN8_9GAMM|nr:DUF3289 family protein [Mixta tenebrionis]
MSNFNFNQYHFLRIWLVSQRYNQFGYRPFITDMEIHGERNGTE